MGLAVFSSNASYFFQLAGNTKPFQVTVILGCVGLAAVIFDAALVDKIGRRRMTVIGFSGACFGVTLIAIVGCLDYANNSKLGALLVFGGTVAVSVLLAKVGGDIAHGYAELLQHLESSTSYAYLTEIPEQQIKARSAGWGLAFCNL